MICSVLLCMTFNHLYFIFRPQTSPAPFNQNQRNYQTYEVPPGGYNQGYNQSGNQGHQNQSGYYQNQGYNQSYGGYSQTYDNSGGYNQGHNQGEKDISFKLENEDSVRLKNQAPVSKNSKIEPLIDEKYALENKESVVKKESLVGVMNDSMEMSSVDVDTSDKPNKETKINTVKRRSRSYRKRVGKLKAKGIAGDIAKQLAKMKPEQMLEFVKHNVGDLNKVKSFIEDLNTTIPTKYVHRKKIKAKQAKAQATTVISPATINCSTTNAPIKSSNTFIDISKHQKQTNEQQAIIMYIKDKTNSLNKRQMKIIQYCLLKNMIVMEKSKQPKIVSWSFKNDYIKVKCANIESKLWLEQYVSQLKPWPTATLSVDVNPNIYINNRSIRKIFKAPKCNTAKPSAISIRDDKEVLKIDTNPLNVNKLEIKEEDFQMTISESLGDIKHSITMNNLVCNTNVFITKSSNTGENAVENSVAWETNVEDLTLTDDYSESHKNKNHVLNYNVPINTEKRTGYTNKMADFDVKMCNYPIFTEEITEDNIVNYPKSAENNFNTEQPQSMLNIGSKWKRKQKSKRQRLREKRRRLQETQTSLPVGTNDVIVISDDDTPVS